MERHVCHICCDHHVVVRYAGSAEHLRQNRYLDQVLYLRSVPPLARTGDENINRCVIQRAARDLLLDKPNVLTDRA